LCAFTLLELLVVIGIISILLVAVVPAVNSLSKSSGRKSAVKMLLGGLEQARFQAIKDGRAAYVVFAAQPVDGITGISKTDVVDRYFYHSFAVFEDDASGNKVQLTPWKTFPTGVSMRTEISFSGANNAKWASDDFAFTPAGTQPQKFPFIKFNANGEVDLPAVGGSGVSAIALSLFEGYVVGKNEKSTTKANKDETINLARLTGRAEYTP
jgi:prepilin-type N-terminal cleavage/methylation domain-containing protein